MIQALPDDYLKEIYSDATIIIGQPLLQNYYTIYNITDEG